MNYYSITPMIIQMCSDHQSFLKSLYLSGSKALWRPLQHKANTALLRRIDRRLRYLDLQNHWVRIPNCQYLHGQSKRIHISLPRTPEERLPPFQPHIPADLLRLGHGHPERQPLLLHPPEIRCSAEEIRSHLRGGRHRVVSNSPRTSTTLPHDNPEDSQRWVHVHLQLVRVSGHCHTGWVEQWAPHWDTGR